MRKASTPGGQAAVEFTLAAPFLFLFFFCVIQMAYTAYVALAVQRAALAVARKASLCSAENSTAFKAQLALSLLPVVNLNRKTALTVFEAQYQITVSPDRKKVRAQVRYPMPIWIPIVRGLFGVPLSPSFDYGRTPEGQALQKLFSILGQPPVPATFQGSSLLVKWIVFNEDTFNEAYGVR